ncbi:thiamine phosphate synthase [Youhaiella tibetensis]|uniref:Thiamine phosphate synthase n=2 Tax=Paradevosia tibetensis TaxID=1447062 RepID=A0A5B9DRA6_9HYPH|nr:thiamine phosphate synthase [Youhaiella tibetensis]
MALALASDPFLDKMRGHSTAASFCKKKYMSAQIFLVAPADADIAAFAPILEGALASVPVSALFLPRGARSENAYKDFVKTVAPIAQSEGCAVLIEGEPGWVRTLGADGLHVFGSAKALPATREAAAALKPQMIVGAGPAASRHDAMGLGELDIDYVLFGPLEGALSAEARDMASWWAQTMEVPAVLSDPQADGETADAAGCEFLAVGESVWKAPQGAAIALSEIAQRLETL